MKTPYFDARFKAKEILLGMRMEEILDPDFVATIFEKKGSELAPMLGRLRKYNRNEIIDMTLEDFLDTYDYEELMNLDGIGIGVIKGLNLMLDNFYIPLVRGNEDKMDKFKFGGPQASVLALLSWTA